MTGTIMQDEDENVTEPSSGHHPRQPRRRWRSQRWLLPAALLALVVLVTGVTLTVRWASEPEDPGMEFVIAAGTIVDVPTVDSAIVIPTDIRFGPDDTAVITVRNNDTIAHRAGPWVVGAGQTYTARFDQPGVYEFECSVDERESVTVTVLDSDGSIPDD